MSGVLPAALAIGALACAAWWRRRHPIPCPARFAWLLENPLMERVAGAEAIVDRLQVEAGMTVLDAGCGAGRVTVALARAVGPGGRVVAVDVQRAMLNRMEDRLRKEGIGNVESLHAALGEGDLPAGLFDRAVLVAVLGEIPDRAAALAEIHAALRPGGLLSITEILPDPDYQGRRAVLRQCERAGFAFAAAYGRGLAYTANFRKPAAASERSASASARSGPARRGCAPAGTEAIWRRDE